MNTTSNKIVKCRFREDNNATSYVENRISLININENNPRVVVRYHLQKTVFSIPNMAAVKECNAI